jgi:uncharacterized protein YuzE
VRYSPESDVLYILIKDGPEDHFVEPIPGLSIEMDEHNQVIGIEVLNASKLLEPFLESVRAKVTH